MSIQLLSDDKSKIGDKMSSNYEAYQNILKGRGEGSIYAGEEFGNTPIPPSLHCLRGPQLQERREFMQSLENSSRPSSVIANIRKGNKPKIV